MAEPIDDATLVSMLQAEERAAVGFFGSTLALEQETALDFYNGEAFGDEVDWRSQVVTRDVAEVVDHMTVSVLRTFVSGDRVVEFEPKSEAEKDGADEATEAVHYSFMRQQNGYRVLHDWLKSGNIEKIGVVKTCVETETKVDRQTVRGVSGEELTLAEQDGVSIIAAEVSGQDEMGAELFDATIERRTPTKVFRDYNIPSEEFLFRPRTRSEDDSGYLAHRSLKTLSDLVEMGFDREMVKGLPSDGGTLEFDQRTTNRYDLDEFRRASEMGDATRQVLLFEEYVRVDRDGDGIAELLCVHRVADTVLSIDEADEQPFVVFTPFPMPHRLAGHSLADKVMDIQRIRSVVLRQTFDNLYLSNAPRTLVHEDSMGEHTLDDILTVRPGGIVRWIGVNRPEPMTTPFVAGASIPIMEMMIGERESRTGITRLNQGLDADALNKTATGTALMQAQGQQIEEYVARNFAECVARLFAKKRRLMKQHGAPMQIRKGDKFTTVDPRAWADDMDICINVGLGSGRKDQRLAYRQQIIALQSEAVANPDTAGLVTPKKLFASAQGLVADMGLGQASDYFVDPEGEEAQAIAEQAAQQPPPPDPETMKVQADMQAKQAELQMKQQSAEMDAQLRQQEGTMKLQLAREEAELKAELARNKAEAELQLAYAKMDAEQQLARERMAMEREIASERAQYDAAAKTEAAKLSSNRPGGSLSE